MTPARTHAGLQLTHRLRRLRRTDAMRALVRETRVTPDTLMLPLFVCGGEAVRRAVPSMPGVFNLSVDELVKEAAAARADGIRGVLLFGLPDQKDDVGSSAYDPEAPVQTAVRALKREVPDLLVVTDVCLCEYTDHGHCGILIDNEIANDPTVVLLVPMFLYFFFIESSQFSRRFLEAIPNPIFEKTYVLFSQFNTKFGEYIMAKFIEATILGTLVTVGLLLVGFPYPFILGFVAGITNILPYIGPVIGFVPALFVALLSKNPDVSMIAMLSVFAVANLIDMLLVFPLLVSKIVNLHPIVVVVSIIIGSQLAGIVGMIVIIPFIAFFKLLFKEIYKDLSVHI